MSENHNYGTKLSIKFMEPSKGWVCRGQQLLPRSFLEVAYSGFEMGFKPAVKLPARKQMGKGQGPRCSKPFSCAARARPPKHPERRCHTCPTTARRKR